MTASLGNTRTGNSTPLYRALRLYVNCFQPSMKLQAKRRAGENVRYMYDPAKTPLQRLLLSGILPAQKQQELIEVAEALDPIGLFHHLEQLQQAVFRCAVSGSPCDSHIPSAPIHVFVVEQCTARTLPAERSVPNSAAGLHILYREQERRRWVLGWRRTHKDPYAGEWEQITSWLLANPERSSGDIFRELQRLAPCRYQPLQIRTDAARHAQNTRPPGLEIFEDQWHEEVIQGRARAPAESAERIPSTPDIWLNKRHGYDFP